MEAKERLENFIEEMGKIQLLVEEAARRLNDLKPKVDYLSIPSLDKLVLQEPIVSAQILKEELQEIHSKLINQRQ